MIKQMFYSAQFTQIVYHYRAARAHPRFFRRLVTGFVLLAASLGINNLANAYVNTQTTAVSIQDLLLDHLPYLRLDDVYLEGLAILIGCITLLGLHRPHKMPFLLKSIALFVAVRSFFMILTHLSLPISQQEYQLTYAPLGGWFHVFTGGNDLFFSGHTGLPFLMALLFWNTPALRYTFLATSVVFGASVLLAHVHYSIDVFAAFFITYSIFHLAIWLFKKDYLLFTEPPTLPEVPAPCPLP